MTEINKAEVYRKAAEIIVRDGKHQSTFVEGWHSYKKDLDDLARRIADRELPVCAIGACLRAELELTGRIARLDTTEDAYDRYNFTVDGWEDVWSFNDRKDTTAEDVALELKRRAEEVDG